MLRLQGFRAIIAGGATGIGAATARMLAQNGAKVVVGDINKSGADKTVDDINKAVGAGTAQAAYFDLANTASIQAMVTQAAEFLGGAVDGLANVAADLSPKTVALDTNVLEANPEDILRRLNTDVVGVFRTTQTVLPLMLKQGNGSIVNVASEASQSGHIEQPAYIMAKAGVNALTRHTTALFGSKGVRANSVSPGMIATELVLGMPTEKLDIYKQFVSAAPVGRPGEPDEVAATITFLLSPVSAYIAGQTIAVNGGVRMGL